MNTDHSLAEADLAEAEPLATGADHPEGAADRFEVRLARLEAQVYAHAERLAEFDAAARARGRRALWLRLIVLLLALGAFFAIKMWGPGSHP